MKLKSITSRDLYSIYKNNFGMKKSPTDSLRKQTGSNAPSKSVGDFSVSKISEINRIDEQNKYIIYRRATNKQFWLDINEELIIKPVRIILEKIERKKQLAKRSKEDANFLNVEKAKQFPITDLIEFKYRVAKCIFHKDHKPSLYFYSKSNTVYCFSCKTYGDSIKVYQTLNNCDFITAVKALQ